MGLREGQAETAHYRATVSERAAQTPYLSLRTLRHAWFGGAIFRGRAWFDRAQVLHLDNPNLDHSRAWPDGWTIRPDPADLTRGTLARTNQAEGAPGRRSPRRTNKLRPDGVGWGLGAHRHYGRTEPESTDIAVGQIE